MSDLIERVARAIAAAQGDAYAEYKSEFDGYARAAVGALGMANMGTSSVFDDADFRELERMVPVEVLNEIVTQNPLHKVYFRAGLLACREYMARFVEHGGNPDIAQSIRANWWPALGPDPGHPRRYLFDEIAEEYTKSDGKPGWRSKPIDPSFEALAIAHGFIGDEPEVDATAMRAVEGAVA